MSQKKPGKPNAADIQRVAAKPWKRLTQLEKLKCCLGQMAVAGSWADLSLGIDREILEQAMRHPRGAVDYLYRRMSRSLTKLLGREVDFFIVGDVDRAGKFHLHGVAGISPSEHDAFKRACWKALGQWDVAARNKQFKIRQSPDFGWVKYITKAHPEFHGNPTSISRGLNNRAARGHDLSLSEWKTRSGVKDPTKMSLTWAITRQEQALIAANAPRMS